MDPSFPGRVKTRYCIEWGTFREGVDLIVQCNQREPAMNPIQGRSRQQSTLFPEVLDDFIPSDHPVRVIDAFIDSLDLKRLGFSGVVAADTGRPGYHPSDLLKLYVYGYLNQLRSSRRLERECARNIELLWLLNRLSPSFKTIAEFRTEHVAALVEVCRTFTRFCRELGLFAAQWVAIDGTKLQAVASRKQVFTAERLAREQVAIDKRIAEYLAALTTADIEEDAATTHAASVVEALQVLAAQREQRHALAEQLQREGVNQHVNGEPDAKLMCTAHGHAVAYNAQIAVDEQHQLIVHAEVTNDGNDRQQLQPMADGAKAVLQVATLNVVADTGYANGEQARTCTAAGITPIVPRPEIVNPKAAGCYTREQFTYDAETDTYHCPAGQTLHCRRTSQTLQNQQYWTTACGGCALKAQCTKSAQRVIVRSFFEADMAAMHQRAMSDPHWMRQRRCLAEHPFGTLKWMMGTPRFLMRGLKKVRGEFALSVLTYNLKRVLNILGVATLLERLRTMNCGLVPRPG
jgi:transposase